LYTQEKLRRKMLYSLFEVSIRNSEFYVEIRYEKLFTISRFNWHS
jgi:hypothetical protein